MGWFMGLVDLIYLIIDIIKTYWIQLFFLLLIILYFKFKTNYKKSDAFLKSKTGFIVLDGKFWTWKTRFMAQLAKESLPKWIFVLSNFYNWYNFIKWNSLEDLKNILYDVWLLGEYQNYTDAELKAIYCEDWKAVEKEKFKIRRELKKKYKYIPSNWFSNRFMVLGDEFQNYFFNRGAMSNFSGDNKNLLKLFHQVRHFNTMLILGTQNSDELDVKFRRLSSYYVNTGEKMGGLFYYYNVYQFITDRENNLNLEKAQKFTKVPVIKLNYYALNGFIKWYERKINRLNFLNKYVNKIVRFKLLTERNIKYRFWQLKFHTKYNVNPDIHTYKSGDIFKKLNDYYKDKDKYHLTDLN